MDFAKKITCESGRVIAQDDRPLFYLNIVRQSRGTGDYGLAPWQADSVARQLARAMQAGLIRIPRDVAEADALDFPPK